jgi:hypothetical protein
MPEGGWEVARAGDGLGNGGNFCRHASAAGNADDDPAEVARSITLLLV